LLIVSRELGEGSIQVVETGSKSVVAGPSAGGSSQRLRHPVRGLPEPPCEVLQLQSITLDAQDRQQLASLRQSLIKMLIARHLEEAR